MDFPSLAKYPYFAIDTETTGLHYKVDEVFGISITLPTMKSYYWDVREHPSVLRWLHDEMKTYKGTVIMFNAQFDYLMLDHSGVHIPEHLIDDAAIRATLIDENLRVYTLDALSERYLGVKKVDIIDELADMFGGRATKNVQMPNLHRAPSILVSPYAIRDTELTLRLWQWQEEQINKLNLHDICEFERKTIPVVLRTAKAGIRVDLDETERAMKPLQVEVDRMQAELDGLLGFRLNANSPKQMRETFGVYETDQGWFTDTGIQCETTAKGNPSINNDVLQTMIEAGDRRAELIVDLRSTIKTKDTFLRNHILGHAVGDRVYPRINQVASENGGTRTGRFSYVDPAMQQIPNRNKAVASIVKPCFLPDEGHVWLDTDLNSFEVRMFAHLVAAYNKALVEYYHSNPDADLHQWVADLMGVPRNKPPEGGANAKQLNLSMIFNSGNGAIAEKLGLPWEWESFRPKGEKNIVTFKKAGPEAMALIERYHRKLPGVKTLAERCKAAVLKSGRIKTMYGRRLRFPDRRLAYKASGLLIQATSADVNKENWSLVDEALDGRGRLLLNTHDSYSMSVDPAHLKDAYKDVKGRIERDVLRVPLKLDLNGWGGNWWEALSLGNKI